MNFAVLYTLSNFMNFSLLALHIHYMVSLITNFSYIVSPKKATSVHNFTVHECNQQNLYLFAPLHTMNYKSINSNVKKLLRTIQRQQFFYQPLKTVYSWLTQNEKPEFLTPSITGTPFLYTYYKISSQLFSDDSTNLFSLCAKNNFFF